MEITDLWWQKVDWQSVIVLFLLVFVCIVPFLDLYMDIFKKKNK